VIKPRPVSKRKDVTIVAGFNYKNGILICGDREESRGASKTAVEKVVTIHADPFNLTVATAGSSAVGELALRRLRETFFRQWFSSNQNVSFILDKHEQIIIDVLTKIHEDHVWNNPVTDHRIQLIIGISFRELHRQLLYLTQDNILQLTDRYCCAGYGEDLCIYFAEHLYRKELTKDEMILLASFIFREVNATRQFCGKGTDMALLRSGELGLHIHPVGVESIQRNIPEFPKVMAAFWDNLKGLPNWVTSIDKILEAGEADSKPSDSQKSEPEQ
jgi:20S proteasome alpha/beta subunit